MRSRPVPVRCVLLAFGCLALGATATTAQTIDAPPLDVREFAAAGIETVPARAASATWLGHLPAHVQVPNAQQRFVAAPVGGRVTALLAGVGESVKQGQPLARLVSPELLTLQREAAQASAERERTQRALERDERLLAEGLIAVSRAEASRSADRQAAALLAEKRGLLALAGARPGAAGELAILAPMSGVVLAQAVRAGERVEPATTLFRIAHLDPLELEIELPLAAAPQVSLGSPVRVVDSQARGVVIAVGRAVSDGQTLTVRARLDSGIAGLNPGQHVEAQIETRGQGDAPALWQVPANALVRLGKAGAQAAVFVRRGDRYVAVAATVAGEAGADLVIRAALREDEPVVSQGASQLKATLAGLGKGE